MYLFLSARACQIEGEIQGVVDVSVDVPEFALRPIEAGSDRYEIEVRYGDDVLAMQPLHACEGMATVRAHPNLVPIMLDVVPVRKRPDWSHQLLHERAVDELDGIDPPCVEEELAQAGIFRGPGIEAAVVPFVALVIHLGIPVPAEVAFPEALLDVPVVGPLGEQDHSGG